jgi:hypothetical protein
VFGVDDELTLRLDLDSFSRWRGERQLTMTNDPVLIDLLAACEALAVATERTSTIVHVGTSGRTPPRKGEGPRPIL